MKFKRPNKPISRSKKVKKPAVEDEIQTQGLISTSLDINTEHLSSTFEDSMDLIIRPMNVGSKNKSKTSPLLFGNHGKSRNAQWVLFREIIYI